MKIRTDFVTNSSSSSYVTINCVTKEGEKFSFGAGADGGGWDLDLLEECVKGNDIVGFLKELFLIDSANGDYSEVQQKLIDLGGFDNMKSIEASCEESRWGEFEDEDEEESQDIDSNWSVMLKGGSDDDEENAGLRDRQTAFIKTNRAALLGKLLNVIMPEKDVSVSGDDCIQITGCARNDALLIAWGIAEIIKQYALQEVNVKIFGTALSEQDICCYFIDNCGADPSGMTPDFDVLAFDREELNDPENAADETVQLAKYVFEHAGIMEPIALCEKISGLFKGQPWRYTEEELEEMDTEVEELQKRIENNSKLIAKMIADF